MSQKQYQISCIRCSEKLQRRRPFRHVNSLAANSQLLFNCKNCKCRFILSFNYNDQGAVKVEVSQSGKTYEPFCPFDRKASIRQLSSLQPTGRKYEGPINQAGVVFEQMQCTIKSCNRVLNFEYIEYHT